MRQEKHTLLCLMFVVTVLGFLAGFGFERFLKAQLNTIHLSRRNLHSQGRNNNDDAISMTGVYQNHNKNTKHSNINNINANNKNRKHKVQDASIKTDKIFYKRNFESRDQTWSDVENEYRMFHDEAVNEVKPENLDEKFKYVTFSLIISW